MTEYTDKVLAWHFIKQDRKLRDGRLVEVGRTYEIEPPLKMCKHGLHASELPLDAVRYAPDSIICRVVCSGEIIRGIDKLVATRREVLWIADVAQALHEFACWCAEQAIAREWKRGKEPDVRSIKAIKVKRSWLLGRAIDEDLIDAENAAWKVENELRFHDKDSWYASRAAAWSASRSAIISSNASYTAFCWFSWFGINNDICSEQNHQLQIMIEKVRRDLGG